MLSALRNNPGLQPYKNTAPANPGFMRVLGLSINKVLAVRRVFSCQLAVLLFVALTSQTAWATSRGAADIPSRWVVLDSTLAELVVALGGAERIVGVVGGTEHLPIPQSATRLEGYRIVAAEPIMSLNPDLVLIGSDRVMPQTIQQLRQSGVRVHQLGAEPDIPSLLKRLHATAELLGAQRKAEELEQEFLSEMKVVEQWLQASLPSKRARAIFVLAGGGRPTVVGGSGTFTGALLTLSGAVNVAAEAQGYKIISQETMLVAAPEFILTNEDGLSSDKDGQPAVLSAPGLRMTPAARNQRIVALPGRHLQGFGLGLPDSIRLLARHIYPNLP